MDTHPRQLTEYFVLPEHAEGIADDVEVLALGNRHPFLSDGILDTPSRHLIEQRPEYDVVRSDTRIQHRDALFTP